MGIPREACPPNNMVTMVNEAIAGTDVYHLEYKGVFYLKYLLAEVTLYILIAVNTKSHSL